MSTEDTSVSTELAPDKKEEKTETPAKEEFISFKSTAAVNDESITITAYKEDKEENILKSDEVEEGFETPEEGEVDGISDEAKEGEVDGISDEAKLDDDQDIENPAYIPKTGKYYMHDSREDSDTNHEEKKSRADGMWSRDRYDERSQQPRSRRQMIEKYGFDIRLGETKEMAEDKEREMRNTGINLDDEYSGMVQRRETNKQRHGRDGTIDRGKGGLRRPELCEEFTASSVERGAKNDEDDIKPAARRDTRIVRGSLEKKGIGEGYINRNGRGEGGNRVERGRGVPPRQFNRTFNNSNRNYGKDDNKDRSVPKRYSTQRAEKDVPPVSSDVPADIVYFDPAKQTNRENKTLMREKKPLDIVPPPV